MEREPYSSPRGTKGVGTLFTSSKRADGYEEMISRDKASLDISWLRDETRARTKEGQVFILAVPRHVCEIT